jgi:hypothetical protein
MTSPARTPVDPSSIRAVRLGHGANCSSIGSVVDTLFVTSLLGGAVFAAIVAGLGAEPVEIVGKDPKNDDGPDEPRTEPRAP